MPEMLRAISIVLVFYKSCFRGCDGCDGIFDGEYTEFRNSYDVNGDPALSFCPICVEEMAAEAWAISKGIA